MDIFKNKKRFLVDYTINGDPHGLIVMARSEDDARRIFEKKVEHKIFGIYPSPNYEVTSVRRVYKKIQF